MTKTKKTVIIDINRCKGCELCVVYCPKKCIRLSQEFNTSGQHPVELVKPEDCNYCGICYMMCPDCAITIE